MLSNVVSSRFCSLVIIVLFNLICLVSLFSLHIPVWDYCQGLDLNILQFLVLSRSSLLWLSVFLLVLVFYILYFVWNKLLLWSRFSHLSLILLIWCIALRSCEFFNFVFLCNYVNSLVFLIFCLIYFVLLV